MDRTVNLEFLRSVARQILSPSKWIAEPSATAAPMNALGLLQGLEQLTTRSFEQEVPVLAESYVASRPAEAIPAPAPARAPKIVRTLPQGPPTAADFKFMPPPSASLPQSPPKSRIAAPRPSVPSEMQPTRNNFPSPAATRSRIPAPAAKKARSAKQNTPLAGSPSPDVMTADRLEQLRARAAERKAQIQFASRVIKRPDLPGGP